jgi:DinB superfamily
LGAFTYPRSEPGSGGHQDLVEKLNAQIAVLRSAVEGVPDAALSQPAPDGWSIKDVVGHLCDVSKITHRRLDMMIRLEEPKLLTYDQDALAKERNADATRIDDLLAEYAAQRSRTVDMLAELVHWNWARPGRHERLGRISIRQQVELWLEHEDNHLAQIRSLREVPVTS